VCTCPPIDAVPIKVEERNNEIKTLKCERRKDKTDFESKMKIRMNELEQQFVSDDDVHERTIRETERLTEVL
jgi:hypothetical protein